MGEPLKMPTTIIVTTSNRDDLLDEGLGSIKRQDIPNLEILVPDDGNSMRTQAVCDRHGVRRIPTGWNAKEWRCPSWGINIGLKEAKGDIVIITSPEMYHVGDCIRTLLEPAWADDHALCMGDCRDDPGFFMRFKNPDMANQWPKMRLLPFLMGVHKARMAEIGGYDEDFTGIGFDDDDIMHRLEMDKCHIIETKARAIHIAHPRQDAYVGERAARNRQLFESRKGKMMRNDGKEWGVIPSKPQKDETNSRFWEQEHAVNRLESLSGHTLEDHVRRLCVEDRLAKGPLHVLCVGVGTGDWVRSLKSKGHKVSALDISPSALARVRGICEGVYLPEQLSSLPKKTFDLAMSLWVSPHMGYAVVLDQIQGVVPALVDGGVFALHYNRPAPGAPEKPFMEVDVKPGEQSAFSDARIDEMAKAAGGAVVSRTVVMNQDETQYKLSQMAVHIQRK
jgi:hypothetical protein